MTIQQIMDKVDTFKTVSYFVMTTRGKIIFTIEDFKGFDEHWDEILVEPDEEEVNWVLQFDGLEVDGWEIRVEYASEDI